MVHAYIRVVPQFAPENTYSVGGLELRRYSAADAARLHEALRRRNVFARHAGDRDFYTQRAREFADQPVILASTRHAHRSSAALRWEADAIEALLVLSTVFAMQRGKLHSQIAGHAAPDASIDLHLDGYTGKPSTRSRRGHSPTPLKITDRCIRRYRCLGLDATVQSLAAEQSFAGDRVRLVCEWLLGSRLDRSIASAFIRTGTAAECLIAGKSREGVTQRMAERIALLTATDATQDRELQRVLKVLYGVRSDFVHGRSREAQTAEATQLEAFDRLVLLGLVSFAQNCHAVDSPEAVDTWFAHAKSPLPVPYSRTFVRRALALA